jgi:hypothetical protein
MGDIVQYCCISGTEVKEVGHRNYAVLPRAGKLGDAEIFGAGEARTTHSRQRRAEWATRPKNPRRMLGNWTFPRVLSGGKPGYVQSVPTMIASLNAYVEAVKASRLIVCGFALSSAKEQVVQNPRNESKNGSSCQPNLGRSPARRKSVLGK